MANALGGLGPMLNYMQNRKYQRDRLAQYDEQMDFRRDQFEETKRANQERERQQQAATRARNAQTEVARGQLGVSRGNLKVSQGNLKVSEGTLAINQAVEKDRSTVFDQGQDTLTNTRTMDKVIPGLGDSITPNRYGGWDVNEEGMNTLLTDFPEEARYIASKAAGFRALNDGEETYDGFTGFTPVTQPDGSIAYAVGVANANTSGPLTAGGSTSDDAQVTLIPAEEMRKIFSQGLSAVHNNGGRDSKAFQTRALGDAVLDIPPFRNPMEQAVGAALGSTAAQLSQGGSPDGVDAIRGTALELNEASYDDLAMILKDSGMTDEEIESTFPRAQTEPQQPEITTNEGDDRTGLSADLTNLLDARDRPRGRGRMNSGIARAANRGRLPPQERAAQEIQDYAAGLEQQITRLEADTTSGHRGRQNKRTLVQKRRDFEYLNPSAVTPDSDLGGIDPPDQTITLGNMRELIVEKGWKPTEDQTNQTADLLRQSGVQTVADIPAKLRPRQATLAMTVLASSQDLDPTQQMDLINKMVNFASTGDTTMGLPQLADDVNAAQNTNIRGQELVLAGLKFNDGIVKAFDKDVLATNEKLANLSVMINDPENGNPIENPEVIAGMAEFRANYKDLRDPASKYIAGNAFKEAAGVLLKKWASDRGPRNMVEAIENLWRRNPKTGMYINDPIQMLRKNKDGDYAFVDPYSGDAIVEGVVPRGMVLDLFGPELEDFMSDLAGLQEPVEF